MFMMENGEQKRATKLRNIFKSQLDAQVSPVHRKTIQHLEISSPILQHSTSIFSLVTPTRTVISNMYPTITETHSNNSTFQLYQPHSPPPPIPQNSSPWSPTFYSPTRSSPKENLKCKRMAGNTTTIIEEENDEFPKLHAIPSKTYEKHIPLSLSDPGQQQEKENKKKNKKMDGKSSIADKHTTATRRHSCSSAISYQEQQKKKKQQQQQSNRQVEIIHFMTLRKLRDWHRHTKVGCESIKGSKSTPSNNKKAYNVSRKCVTEQIMETERKKKMQEELEDLITGRRTSTLKLSLTPKGLC